MSKKSDLIVLQEMSQQDMDIKSSCNLVGGRKVKQGAILEIGVDYSTFQQLALQMATNNVTHYVVTYIVNKEQFDKLKG